MNHLYGYRDLLAHRVLFEVRKDARQLYMGALWWIIEPAAQIAVLYLVFGVLLPGASADFAGFLVVGFVFWRWFDSACKKGMLAITGAGPILTQVRLPPWLFPVSDVLSVSLRFLAVLVLLIPFARLYSGQFGAAYLALPALLLLQLLLMLSIGVLLAVIAPFFPDSAKIVDNLFLLLFFSSGIFYDIRALGEPATDYLYLNPMAVLLTMYRDILLAGQWPDSGLWLRVGIAAAASFTVALLCYRACRPSLTKALLR